jgi:hypothetical protein
MQLVAISCNQLQSVAISGNQWQSVAILWPSVAYPMDAELSRYLYPHWSRKGMKHLCCWKPPCACTGPPMDLAIGH